MHKCKLLSVPHGCTTIQPALYAQVVYHVCILPDILYIIEVCSKFLAPVHLLVKLFPSCANPSQQCPVLAQRRTTRCGRAADGQVVDVAVARS